MFKRVLTGVFNLLNRWKPWHALSPWLGIPNLLKYRIVLREENLHDTWTPGALRRHQGPVPHERLRRFRTPDGSWNDLEYPDMGKAGTRFGRNTPFALCNPDPEADLLHPSPREVSRRLLKRDVFKPATTLNVLAAAWIQFQTHDWFNHGQPAHADDDIRIDIDESDDWPVCPMRIPRTRPDPTRSERDEGLPRTHVNLESHWWDASGVYGSDEKTMRRLRALEGGKLTIEANGKLPIDPVTGFAKTGLSDNWWIGLALLHTLFAREHNAVCDRLQEAYPDWSDERLYQTARLVIAALTAKIQTIEWTPAITDHPTLHVAMNANWDGLLPKRWQKLLGPLARSEVLGGIPSVSADHGGVPFQLTEEFVSVYRLHPLIPDELVIRSYSTGETVKVLPFKEVTLHEAVDFDETHGVSFADLWYSLAVAHPGAPCLKNYPAFLRDFTRPDGVHLDVATVDIVRDRERGIPRYNDFRRMLHRPALTSFDELTDDAELAAEIRDVYRDDIERVDTMVGMFAETPPPGFGFSDTAFRIFILMASRRLRSDRFLTTDFRPEIYTPEGIQWVEENDMKSLILRHYPELGEALRDVGNPFAPWE